jgi:hypothetical protein
MRSFPSCAILEKSTNVRVDMPGPAREQPARAIALALAAWAGAVALGAWDDVFLRLGTATDVALAIFAALFAVGVYALDDAVRGAVDALPAARIAAIALTGDAALAMALSLQGSGALFGGAFALATLFAAPLASAAHVPLARAIAARRFRSAAARSPGARRAAT